MVLNLSYPTPLRLLPRLWALVRWPALGVAATAAVYAGLSALPGDAVGVGAQPLDPVIAAQRRRQLGLDRPLIAQYWTWLTHALRGDLGVSTQSRAPVANLLGTPLANSAVLAAGALLIAIVAGVVLGAVAGTTRGTPADAAITTGVVAVISSPEFVVATVLALILGSGLGLFPTVSLAPIGSWAAEDPTIIGLPLITLAVTSAAVLSRSVRGVVAAEAKAPYISALRMAGMSERRILTLHILPGCRGSIAQAAAVLIPSTCGGAVVVEKFFGYPGLGTLLVDAVAARDVPLAMAASVILVAVAVVAYGTADLIAQRAAVRA